MFCKDFVGKNTRTFVVCYNSSVRNNNCSVRVFEHKVHVMGYHYYGNAEFFVQLFQKVHYFGIMRIVLTGSRFVQNNDLRVHDKNRGYRYALFLAEADCRYRPVPVRVHSAYFERVTYFLLYLVSRHFACHKSERNFIKNYGLGNHLVLVLHYKADFFAALFYRKRGNVFAFKQDFAGIGLYKAADQRGKCRFSCSVCTYNA